jgi:hypothetical protein
MTTKQCINLIIKEVGVNGLIAIKNNRLKCGLSSSLYKYIGTFKKHSNAEFIVHSLMWGNLTHIKDFSQYQ